MSDINGNLALANLEGRRERYLPHCDVCGGKRFKSKFARNEYHSDIVQCHDCGFTFSNPQVEVNYEKHLNYLGRHLKTERGRRLTSRWRLDQIPTSVMGTKLLEIGCSVGFFLDEARGRGFDVTGAELNVAAVRYAREKLGLKVFDGDVLTLGAAGNRFDVIAMFDVFEHIPEPTAFLTELANQLLQEGGVILCEVPNLFSMYSKLQGTRSIHLQFGHYSYYNPATFVRVAGNAGLEVVSFRYGKRVYPLADCVFPFLKRQPRLQKLVLKGLENLSLNDLVVKVGLDEFLLFICRKASRTPPAPSRSG